MCPLGKEGFLHEITIAETEKAFIYESNLYVFTVHSYLNKKKPYLCFSSNMAINLITLIL